MKEQLKELTHWSRSMTHAQPVDAEYPATGAWEVGALDDDGDQQFYPVLTVDADQYDAPGDSEKIAMAIIGLWAEAFAEPSQEILTGVPFPRPALLSREFGGVEAAVSWVVEGTDLALYQADEGWRGYYKEEDVQALHLRVRQGLTEVASLERTVARLQALLKLRTEQLAALGGAK